MTCGGYDPLVEGCPLGYWQNVWSTNWGTGNFYFCAKESNVADVVGTICGMSAGTTGISLPFCRSFSLFDVDACGLYGI